MDTTKYGPGDTVPPRTEVTYKGRVYRAGAVLPGRKPVKKKEEKNVIRD